MARIVALRIVTSYGDDARRRVDLGIVGSRAVLREDGQDVKP